MSLKIYDLVWVEWIDAEHEGEWSELGDEEDHEIAPCESCGWLVHENADRIVLCTSTALKHDGTVSELGNKQYIPRGMVKTLVVIKRKTNARRARKKRDVSAPPKKEGV